MLAGLLLLVAGLLRLVAGVLRAVVFRVGFAGRGRIATGFGLLLLAVFALPLLVAALLALSLLALIFLLSALLVLSGLIALLLVLIGRMLVVGLVLAGRVLLPLFGRLAIGRRRVLLIAVFQDPFEGVAVVGAVAGNGLFLVVGRGRSVPLGALFARGVGLVAFLLVALALILVLIVRR